MKKKQKEKVGVFQCEFGKYAVGRGDQSLGSMRGGFHDFVSAKRYAIEQYKKDGVVRYILYMLNAKVVYAE